MDVFQPSDQLIPLHPPGAPGGIMPAERNKAALAALAF